MCKFSVTIWQNAASIYRDFPSSLSQILVNRLVLNLREIGNRDNSTISEVSHPRFATNRFLDNIGASMRSGSDDMHVGDDFEEHGIEEYVL